MGKAYTAARTHLLEKSPSPQPANYAKLAGKSDAAIKVPGWWSQTVTVGYERVKGLRAVGPGPGKGECEMKRESAMQIGVYALAIALASMLWRRPIILALCYVVLSVLMLSRWHTRGDVFFYGAAFALGPAGELVAVHFGAWEYSRPLYLIPVWLPFLWGIVALFFKKLSEAILR